MRGVELRDHINATLAAAEVLHYSKGEYRKFWEAWHEGTGHTALRILDKDGLEVSPEQGIKEVIAYLRTIWTDGIAERQQFFSDDEDSMPKKRFLT